MLGSLYTLVDDRTECKPAGGAGWKLIKDVMHFQSGAALDPAVCGRFARLVRDVCGQVARPRGRGAEVRPGQAPRAGGVSINVDLP